VEAVVRRIRVAVAHQIKAKRVSLLEI